MTVDTERRARERVAAERRRRKRAVWGVMAGFAILSLGFLFALRQNAQTADRAKHLAKRADAIAQQEQADVHANRETLVRLVCVQGGTAESLRALGFSERQIRDQLRRVARQRRAFLDILGIDRCPRPVTGPH